ncbi:hypothetical protein RHGRI_001590 [Rhododendron griersonianum]|uniref:Uncharacterized protein n=1 Tax=Rhododendron griersonianum TaxID=479676 RepID=A0AAV6LPQ4_9ERIC|nr:hypothetical protein RHGRI_001590 [Rhododendron griersonianum]
MMALAPSSGTPQRPSKILMRIATRIRMLQMTVRTWPMMLAMGPTPEMVVGTMRLMTLLSTSSTAMVVIRRE